MRALSEKICLVIPCYNEAARLDFDALRAAAPNCYFLFVNDGSQDKTLEVLKRNTNDKMYVLNLSQNVGKGEAVRQGMLYLKNLPVYQEINWVGYWDADLAAPLKEVNNFLVYARTFNSDVDAIWGSRVAKLGSVIKRSFQRHILGRVFTTIVSLTLHVNSYDSQCGAKLFKKELIAPAFGEPFISRWIFDVEIFLRLRHFHIIEYPLQEWRDISGGKIKIIPVAFRTIFDIGKIRKKYRASLPER